MTTAWIRCARGLPRNLVLQRQARECQLHAWWRLRLKVVVATC